MFNEIATKPITALDVARGKVPGVTHVNKFGHSTNVDTNINTDVWDGANASDDVDVWVAPTQARVHAIASTSNNDSGTGGTNPESDGARTVRVYGLINWDTAEVNELVVMDGTNPVNTANSYVIIHRMFVETNGGNAAGPNVGVISATAAIDGTLTAQINAGIGQTQMGIYGIPSTQTAYISKYYASVLKPASACNVLIKLMVNVNPNLVLTGFMNKHINGLESTGSSYLNHCFDPHYVVNGPAIIKIQANSNALNTEVSAGFDIYLINN